jgi:ribosomal protein S12 methylthiotransferase
MKKTFYIHRLGCPKNDADAETMAGMLTAEGFQATEDSGAADVCIVNTCGFIGDAKQESLDAVLDLVAVRRPEQQVMVASCLYQRYGKQLVSELPEVDAWIGTGAVDRVVDALAAAPGEGRQYHEGEVFLARADSPRVTLGDGLVAYVKIGDGCDRRCAFCAIPLFKGSQQSRPGALILPEVADLSAKGMREIVLVAQDTSAWGRDLEPRERLPELLASLDAVPDYAWLRMLYLYPDRVDEALLEQIAHQERLLPYFDMPMQHAADAVLTRMRRGTSRAVLEDCIGRIRARIPEAVLRSAFIVGFPGETEADFQALCDFVKCMKLDNVGVFTFSEEEGTAAFDMDGAVELEERERRRDELMEIQAGVSEARLAARVGQRLDLLVEELVAPEGPEGETSYIARFYGQAPEVDGVVYLRVDEGATAPAIGDLVQARVEDHMDYDLFAVLEAET